MASYEIRAMSFGEIIDGAFALYRHDFGLLVGIAVITTGIPTILNVYLTAVGIELANPVLLLLWVLLLSVGGLMAGAATVWVISEIYLGMEPDLGESLRFALTKMAKLFIAGLAKYFVIWLAAVVPGAIGGVGIALAGVSVPSVMILLIAVAAGLGAVVILASGYAVVTQAVVLEDDTSATDALRRSWSLTKGFKRKAFGLGVVLLVLFAVPYMVVGVLGALVPSLEVVIAAAGGFLQLIVYPIFACAFTLLYYDLRVRNEAFDLEHLSQQLGFDRSGE
ncbi:MAG: hypothetical protein ACE5HT_04470 [Gemmatimonadales bacterium]